MPAEVAELPVEPGRCRRAGQAPRQPPTCAPGSRRRSGRDGRFDLIQTDPVVSQVKLIAEPWDLGEGGYQVGNFPTLWSEWNGRYRDRVRDYWRGADRTLADLAYRLTGSSDLYGRTGRRPSASVNFVTAHDGFTMADLVAYNSKHNVANGEDNRDGTDDNRSPSPSASSSTATRCPTPTGTAAG